MDAIPFRQFLRSKVYASKEELSDAAGRCCRQADEGTEDFCQWVPARWDDWRSRPSVGEYIQQRDSCKLCFLRELWFRVVEQELFNIWSVLHKEMSSPNQEVNNCPTYQSHTVTKGIQIGAGKVDLEYSQPYASMGDSAEGPLVGR